MPRSKEVSYVVDGVAELTVRISPLNLEQVEDISTKYRDPAVDYAVVNGQIIIHGLNNALQNVRGEIPKGVEPWTVATIRTAFDSQSFPWILKEILEFTGIKTDKTVKADGGEPGEAVAASQS